MQPPEAVTVDGHDPSAEPTHPVPTSWVARLGLAGVGMCAGWFGPIQVLLGLQAASLTPDHKEATLSLVTGIGAAVSTLANPLAGAFSDRTTSRWGRRVPWVVGGTLVGAVGLVLLAMATTVPGMVLGWCLVQAGLNGTLAALTAAIPDLVPVEQRGLVSGVVGMTQTLGIVVGTGVATLVAGTTAAYLVLAVLVVAAVTPFVLGSLDRPLPRGHLPRIGVGAFLAGFWISPRRHPDFAWAWATRFLATIANSICTMYLLFFLTDAVGVEDPELGVLVLTLLYAACLVVSAIVAGAWSDRLGVRKPFVMVSGVVMSCAAALLAIVQTWSAALVGAVILGIGYGVYLAVDFALITQVLPRADDRARDLGVINIANALPQVLAPAIAGPIITWFAAHGTHADGYRALYLLAAAIGIAAALLIRKIRTVD
ncbi:MFS transporter [Janibacter sp. CX7]|uniref:MFS transporter n=1 Tax=Janibacter sp. CX7 TaxID=2963431 RepID=UPI0020CC1195|nr:MFS transporter [Janibacter sp. CX7]UTT67493.1 MFS transporter [Janibacter sp. CX7]